MWVWGSGVWVTVGFRGLGEGGIRGVGVRMGRDVQGYRRRVGARGGFKGWEEDQVGAGGVFWVGV